MFSLMSVGAVAQPGDAQPNNGPVPLLRHDPGGPDSVVKSLLFAPDGQTLYVAGWNKIVQLNQDDDLTERIR